MGELIPVLCSDVLPGDVWRLRSQPLNRFAPMLAPIMHSVNVHLHCFFVPNRIVWPNWEDFISPPKANSTPPAHPFINAQFGSGAVWQKGSLADYLGLPVQQSSVGVVTPVNAIPFAAYQKIWNEYYRDQNLQCEVTDTLTNGSNAGAVLATLRNRSWMHDYFTGSLPFAQKGAAVSIPVDFDGEAPVYRNNSTAATFNLTGSSTPATGTTASVANIQSSLGQQPNSLYVDLSSAGAVNSGTINDLRTAMRTQEFLERQARGGSRYIEQIRMQFGVKSSDARLQRPEYIGGVSSPVIISEVLQTSETTGSGTPQATMAGHGYSASKGYNMRYYAEEHGYIFVIMSVTPKTAYQQGIPRHFSRRDMYDYAWPVLAHIGEQEVLNKELYVANDGQNENTFGYVPRYSEYRYIPSHVAGDFRDNLNFWHLGRTFANRPQLNADFVQIKPVDTKRIFAVQDANIDSLWCHVFFDLRVSRLLPKYGTPTL